MHLLLTSIPARKLVAVTPSDTTTFDPPLRGIYVGGAGNISLIAAEDSAAVTLSNVTANTFLPISVTKVMSTSTTATLIVGLR